ncbi:DUF1912 family protein [Streptococcus entericus]|uniref:DUF1912 family protein n=1 Tax=Streptococcus entericus TaxID=155680 RepID=UPI000381A068
MAEQFLTDFEEWVRTQVMINDMAMVETKKVIEETGDERAMDAYIRYESKLDAYNYILGKFSNYHQGKSFHDLPDNLLNQRHYK